MSKTKWKFRPYRYGTLQVDYATLKAEADLWCSYGRPNPLLISDIDVTQKKNLDLIENLQYNSNKKQSILLQRYPERWL